MEHDEQESLFCFRERVRPMDWRSLDAVDLQHIVQTCNPKLIQGHVYDFTFAVVDERDIADPLAVKLIKVFQFCIEYMLYVRKLDAEEMQDLEDEVWHLDK